MAALALAPEAAADKEKVQIVPPTRHSRGTHSSSSATSGSTGLQIDRESQVLRTEKMADLDWQRTVTHAGVVDCLRQTFVSGLPKGQRLVSFGTFAFPKVAKLTAAFRGLVDVGTGKSADRILFD